MKKPAVIIIPITGIIALLSVVFLTLKFVRLITKNIWAKIKLARPAIARAPPVKIVIITLRTLVIIIEIYGINPTTEKIENFD